MKDVISNNFIKLFEKQDGLTIDKTSEIFEYYLRAIFGEVKIELKKYQMNLDEDSKKMIEAYNEKDKKHIISKEDLAYAIRLFITLVLLLEDNKEKKIKQNENNIMNYLKSEDLWKNEIFKSEKFNNNIYELKLMKFKINQIIPLYDVLGKEIENNFFDDVKRKIEEENEEEKEKEIGKEIEHENEKIKNPSSDEDENEDNDNPQSVEKEEEEEEEEDDNIKNRL